MARLAWIRVRAGTRNRLSEENMIAQKPRPDEGRSVGGTLRTPSATLHAVTPLCRTGQLLDCRQPLPNRVTSEWPVIRPESGPDLVTEVASAIACFRRAAKLFDSLRRISG